MKRFSDMTTEEFDALLEESLRYTGDRLYEEDRTWRDSVPDSFASAARASVADPVRTRPVLPAAKGILLAAVLTLSAAGAVTAGVYYGSPAVREAVNRRIVAADAAQAKAPADYVIPDPWEEYELVDEAAGDSMVYKWFRKDKKQVLVEIGYRLPADMQLTGEAVTVGGLEGVYRAESPAVLLHGDGVDIFIGCWNGSREDTLAYAAALIEANR